jgi:hypothetical protein
MIISNQKKKIKIPKPTLEASNANNGTRAKRQLTGIGQGG